MKVVPQVIFRGMAPSEAIEASVRERVDKLERFCANIMSCRVNVELLQKHRHQGRPFGVRIDLTVPGHELVVSRIHVEDFQVALRDAFDDMKRQIEDAVRHDRGQQKEHALPLHGQVVRLNDLDGFGFIATPGGDEYYFSRDNVVGTPFEHVQVDDDVQFIADAGDQGPQAKRVSLGKHHVG
jgi:ribosomal subunit interface protein